MSTSASDDVTPRPTVGGKGPAFGRPTTGGKFPTPATAQAFRASAVPPGRPPPVAADPPTETPRRGTKRAPSSGESPEPRGAPKKPRVEGGSSPRMEMMISEMEMRLTHNIDARIEQISAANAVRVEAKLRNMILEVFGTLNLGAQFLRQTTNGMELVDSDSFLYDPDTNSVSEHKEPIEVFSVATGIRPEASTMFVLTPGGYVVRASGDNRDNEQGDEFPPVGTSELEVFGEQDGEVVSGPEVTIERVREVVRVRSHETIARMLEDHYARVEEATARGRMAFMAPSEDIRLRGDLQAVIEAMQGAPSVPTGGVRLWRIVVDEACRAIKHARDSGDDARRVRAEHLMRSAKYCLERRHLDHVPFDLAERAEYLARAFDISNQLSERSAERRAQSTPVEDATSEDIEAVSTEIERRSVLLSDEAERAARAEAEEAAAMERIRVLSAELASIRAALSRHGAGGVA